MAEAEAGEFTFTLDELTRRFTSEGDHPVGSGEYDFTNGLRIRTDEARNEAARRALDKEYDGVVMELGTATLKPAHWRNVLGVLSFPTLMRIAADSSLIEKRRIPQSEMRNILAKKAGYEAAEFGSARVDKLQGEDMIFRPGLGNATAGQLRVGIAVLTRFQDELLSKGSYYGVPRGQRA